ncbi:zincin [Coprinellus micaceus]|uniref:Zincin n=1 Tax=Coprinellus micaceus TaxID=71717 RepID=A0A4Y7RQG3_COPMI|nr:zincin [Coprinellus micaceus]
MLLTKVVALSLSFASVWAAPSPPPQSSEVLEVENAFTASKTAPKFKSLKASAAIEVYWHVVSKNSSVAGGNILDSQIAAQITILNEAYSTTGLSFSLAGVDRVVNATWFNKVTDGTREQTEMKRALRKGGAYDLNVYSSGFVEDPRRLLGYATWPWDYAANPQNDGVVIHSGTVPGGDNAPYNLGHTLTHEAGHWVGLLHTFQGGCNGAGDQVADTPPEARPAFGCEVGRDTCTADRLPDPVHNFMDYSDDSCMTEFTAGQAARLTAAIATYRTQ